jgi:hypothetical protein
LRSARRASLTGQKLPVANNTDSGRSDLAAAPWDSSFHASQEKLFV